MGLTDRQAQVLALLVQGKPNKVICRELELAVFDRLEVVPIGLDRRVDNLPLGALVVEGHRLDVLLGRMGQHAADIALRIFRD